MSTGKLRVTSPDHFYMNDHLIDMNMVRLWFNSNTWASHSPSQTIKTLEALLRAISNGYMTYLSDQELFDRIQLQLQALDYYGYHVDDICFKNGSLKFYRLIPGIDGDAKMQTDCNSRLDNYVVPENWWKAKDPERFPRIDL